MSHNSTRALLGLALLLSLVLAACQTDVPDEPEGAGGEGEEDVAAPDEESLSVAFVSQVEGIPYFQGMEEGGMEAAEEFGVEYVQEGPAEASSPDQLRIFEALIAREFDAIAISPLDPGSAGRLINDAVEAGVTTVTSDADAPDSDREVYVAQATDQALGYTLMDDLARQIDESGEIAIVSGEPDTATFEAWIGFIEERIAEEYPDIEVVGGIRHTTDSEEALTEAEDLLTAHPDLEGLIAIPSTAVPGVAQAVQNAGLTGDVAVIGYGSPNTAREFVHAGVMETTVLWDVKDLGYLTVWTMQHLAEGGELEEENDVPGLDDPVEYDSDNEQLILGPPTIFDESNIDDFDF